MASSAQRHNLLLLACLCPTAGQFGTIKVDWSGGTAEVNLNNEADTNVDTADDSCWPAVPPEHWPWDTLEGSVTGALIADALALRDHYEYSIERTLPRGIIHDYEDPAKDNLTPGWGSGPTCFHPTRRRGELTDYGENALWVLRSAVLQRRQTQKFEETVYASHWVNNMQEHDGYVNMASRHALAVMQKSGRWSAEVAARPHGDMPGPARAAGLAPAFRDAGELQEAARAVSGLTHSDELSDAAAVLLASVPHCLAAAAPLVDLRNCLRNALPPGATGDAELPEDADPVLLLARTALDKAREVQAARGAWRPSATLREEDVRADDAALATLRVAGRGQLGGMPKASPTMRVLPEAIYLVLRYESDFAAGITSNAMLGGDSAARAMLVGSWLGAAAGAAALPPELVKGLRAGQEVRALVGELRTMACRV